ncbi:hypothetical protein NDU88_001241 [Pleurodeles waltl]|uniref:Uncharacterized protein n=1 Tax=Pleurodeles waltl TaxID=8319 RepID=A0AAV7M7L8_PLEWA|nr:hypothetical protein NDU88_001241 [Pleurodeles waltl]
MELKRCDDLPQEGRDVAGDVTSPFLPPLSHLAQRDPGGKRSWEQSGGRRTPGGTEATQGAGRSRFWSKTLDLGSKPGDSPVAIGGLHYGREGRDLGC